MKYTPEQIKEYRKCAKDPFYFINNYVKVVTLDKGLQQIKLRDYQRDMIKNYINNRFNIVLAARQSGKSVSYVCFILWYVLFNKDKTVAILANKGATAMGILQRVELAYYNLPLWLQQEVITWNKGSFELANGCSVFSAASSSEAIRGASINCVSGDTIISLLINGISYQMPIQKAFELYPYNGNNLYNIKILGSNSEYKSFDGFIQTKSQDIFEIIINNNILQCTSNHRLYFDDKLISANIISDKKYLGKQTVFDAVNVGNDSLYVTNNIISHNCLILDEAAFVPHIEEFWSSVFPTISGGQSSKVIMVSTANGENFFYDRWAEANDGTGSFHPYEVHWWQVPGRDEKWKKEQLGAMTQDQFDQEYGNIFAGSSDTLMGIPEFRILKQTESEPIEYTRDMKIFAHPEPGHKYLLSCDPASVGNDYSAFHVIDITQWPFTEVLEYANNEITHLKLPQLLAQIAYKYNTASVLVENNEIGQVILHILNYDLEYPEVISTKTSSMKFELGVKTTSKSKTLGCARFKEMVAKKKLIVKGKRTIDELKHFTLQGANYKAEESFHDDLTMSFVIFCYYVNTPSFHLNFEQSFNDEMKSQYEKETFESLAPMPMFGNEIAQNSKLLEGLELLKH